MPAPDAIPAGYLPDAQGRLVPLGQVRDVDLARDALVKELMSNALELQEALRSFRLRCLADCAAFAELSAERYGAKVGGSKGNLTLTSYDGNQRIQVALQEYLDFDEGIHAAKSLIDQCLTEWSADSRPELRTLILDAFRVDQQGRIDARRILSLRKLDIQDDRWRRAMEAISDSLRVAGSKTYVRFHRRGGPDNAWHPVSLDLAAL